MTVSTICRRLLLPLSSGAALGAALTFYAWQASKRVELTRVPIVVPGLPPGLEGLRILHVADTHFPANGESLERFLRAAKSQDYDIVFATGDYADTSDGWPVVVEAFRRLKPGLGIYASLGGHERYPGAHHAGGQRTLGGDLRRFLNRVRGSHRALVDPAPLIAALEEVGVTVLVNENHSIELGGELVHLIAIDDAYLGLADLEHALPEPGGDGFRLLLSHTPDGLLHPRAAEVNLALSGHTHGGQIRLPFYGAPVRHARSVDRIRTAGLLQISGVPTFVSRGFGTALFPLRLGARPELAVLELHRAD
jgi:predicted MPP superfamily phosphohydrolase